MDETNQLISAMSKRELRKEARAQSIVHIDNEDVFLVSPKSHLAASIFSYSTKWCIANGETWQSYYYRDWVSFYIIQLRGERLKKLFPNKNKHKIAVVVDLHKRKSAFDSADVQFSDVELLKYLYQVGLHNFSFKPNNYSDRIDEYLNRIAQSRSYLTTLDLNSRELKFVPDSLGKLSNLTALYLSNNRLTTLPISITALKKLRTLYLFDNRLSDSDWLEEILAEFTGLDWLGLTNNNLSKGFLRRLKQRLPNTRIYGFNEGIK